MFGVICVNHWKEIFHFLARILTLLVTTKSMNHRYFILPWLPLNELRKSYSGPPPGIQQGKVSLPDLSSCGTPSLSFSSGFIPESSMWHPVFIMPCRRYCGQQAAFCGWEERACLPVSWGISPAWLLAFLILNPWVHQSLPEVYTALSLLIFLLSTTFIMMGEYAV